MDRIESLGSNFSYREAERKKVKKRKSGAAGSFASFLRSPSGPQESEGAVSVRASRLRESLEELLDEVYDAGDRLKEKPTLDAIRAYRDAVRAFLKLIVTRMLKIEKKKSGIKIEKRRIFFLISTMDRKLENLVLAVLRGQASQLAVLERVDEINGLIVDILS